MADESKTGILGRLPPLPREALNNSVIGMEQAYRQRKGLPLLTDPDIEALKGGQPMWWEEGGSGVSAAPASAAVLHRRRSSAGLRSRRRMDRIGVGVVPRGELDGGIFGQFHPASGNGGDRSNGDSDG